MDDPLLPNPYKTLSVSKDATLATIRSAHRKLVLLCHPDKVQDERAKKSKAEQFHQVQQAYEILSDEIRRRRFDARVKLAELRDERAEMMDERPPPRRSHEYSPKTAPSPMFSEMRNGREYVEVKPKAARYEDEGDVFSHRFAGERARRFDEHERRFDDRYAEPVPRKTSGRAQEDRRKFRDRAAEEYERERADQKAREMVDKAKEASLREQAKRRKDRETRRDRETKTKEKFEPNWTEHVGSDSEPERYHSSGRGEKKPKRKTDDSRRNSREEPQRRGSKVKDQDETTSLDEKIYQTQDYISKSREAVNIDPPRSRRSRASSNVDRTPPPPPLSRPSEAAKKRRAANERASSPPRKTGKDKRATDIVDPPSGRKPNLSAAKSDPKGFMGMFGSRKEQDSRKEPQRASTTFQIPIESKQSPPDFKKPSLRRAETVPIRRSDATPFTPSQLRKTKAPSSVTTSSSSNPSDSDSDVTPEIITARHSPPRQQSKRYFVSKEDPRIVDEPEDYRSSREPSPKPTRKSTERPLPFRSASSRMPPVSVRSASYAKDDRPGPSPRQKLNRAESERPILPKHHSSHNSPRLYGEKADYDEEPRTPKYSPMDDLRYPKPYGRRGSGEIDPDEYSYHKQPRRREAVYA